LYYYSGSYVKALINLFPEIHLEEQQFPFFSDKWIDPTNRRRFFDRLASVNGFDPLVAANWRSINCAEMRKYGGRGITKYYHESFIKTLTATYPEFLLSGSDRNF